MIHRLFGSCESGPDADHEQADSDRLAHVRVAESDGGEREDEEGNEDRAKGVVAREHRQRDEGDGREGEHGPAVLRDGEQREVCAVAALELAVFSVEHRSLSTPARPPEGR